MKFLFAQGLLIFLSCVNDINTMVIEYFDDINTASEFQRKQWLESIPDRDTFEQKCLEMHNNYRARHCASPLVLDETLNNDARVYAEKLAETRTLVHNPHTEHGENALAATTRLNNRYFNGFGAVGIWYKEIENFDFNAPSFNAVTGHFTQMIWKATKKLGVGYATSSNGTHNFFYIVAYYDPPGNFVREFQENVSPAVC